MKKNSNRLVHLFFEMDLRASHDGLKDYLRHQGIKPETLGAGDCVIFVNRAYTLLKMFASGTEVLVHLKKDGGRIAPETLRILPKYLGGSQIHYEAALGEAIREHMKKRHGEKNATWIHA